MTEKHTILIVDDEEALRKALIFDFKRKGYTVLGAENGRVAYDIILSQKVDLVLSDVRMPNGDGVELIERVKSFNPSVPVIMFITGFTDMTLEEAYHKGAAAIFSKPFDRKVLMAAVENVLKPAAVSWAQRPERIKVDLAVEITCKNFSSSVEGKILNIGRGGMFLSSDGQLPQVGAVLGFKISFEEGKPSRIEGEGIVRWVRTTQSSKNPAGTGIEFSHLAEECRNDILALIERLRAKPFIPQS